MNTIEVTNLQAISGGCKTCPTHLDQAERALYIQQMRPTVIKEAAISGAVFGGIVASVTACFAGPAIIAGAGIVTSAYVAQHVYNNSEMWLSA
jgi:outer membrane lipoprotein SlyB